MRHHLKIEIFLVLVAALFQIQSPAMAAGKATATTTTSTTTTTTPSVPTADICCQLNNGQLVKGPKAECEQMGYKVVNEKACEIAHQTICCQSHPDGCLFPEPRQNCLLDSPWGWGGVEAPGPCKLPEGPICCRPPAPREPGVATADGCCANGYQITDMSVCEPVKPTTTTTTSTSTTLKAKASANSKKR